MMRVAATGTGAWMLTFGDSLVPLGGRVLWTCRRELRAALAHHGLRMKPSGLVEAVGPNPFDV